LLEIGIASWIVGIISEYFGNIKFSYIILLLLILIDTGAGVSAAIKYNRFCCKGLKKIIKKALTYSTSIFTVRLLEIVINSLFKTTLLSQVMVAFLAITETISILENLALIGVPIPSNLVKLLMGSIKLPVIGNVFENTRQNDDKYINEIDDIIKYQVTTFNDSTAKSFLESILTSWRNAAIQLSNAIKERDEGNNELIFYKTQSIIQLSLKDIELKWKELDIPRKFIEKFSKIHQDKVDSLMNRVKEICMSDLKVGKKKQMLVESIIIMLYQTITDAHKNMQ